MDRRTFLLGAAAIPLLLPRVAHAMPPDLDITVMSALVELARARLDTPHPQPFVSCVTRSGYADPVVTEFNAVREQTDPTAHAEVQAIRAACKKVGSIGLHGYTLYTTCEPCPMCAAAAVWAGVDRIVFGAAITDVAPLLPQLMVPCKDVVASARPARPIHVTERICNEPCVALFTHPRVKAVLEGYSKSW